MEKVVSVESYFIMGSHLLVLRITVSGSPWIRRLIPVAMTSRGKDETDVYSRSCVGYRST